MRSTETPRTQLLESHPATDLIFISIRTENKWGIPELILEVTPHIPAENLENGHESAKSRI